MFNNLKIAFADKSNYELNRAYILFVSISNPIIAKILTTLVKTALWMRMPIKAIIRNTVYKHFCGGTSIEDCQHTINKLWKSQIGTILDYSSEGKESINDFNKVMHETISALNKAKSNKKIPFCVFKPTGLARFNLLEKISLNKQLTTKEENEKYEFEMRIQKICNTAYENNVRIFFDAEESWIQNAVDEVAKKMMVQFNKNDAIIFNTIQLYRIDSLNYIKELIKVGKKNNFFVGLKLVRGAYHQQEIDRARRKGYKCPVHKIKKNTDNYYNKALEICIKEIKTTSICAGTHNEQSSAFLINLLKKNNITKNDKRVHFSQLLGMSDNISYNAAKQGFNVSKYVPYGPVEDVIPYLIRRAEENTSISGQMGRELKNIVKEKLRRSA